MKPTNMLVIMSDEHNPRVLGASGHPIIRTPNLDALAARGTRFSDAACNSPICVPSRASFATGRYVHQIRFWDNAMPYDGSVPSWGHRLQQAGHAVTSIGKLHFRSAEDDNGFDEEILPMHVIGGVGMLPHLLRKEVRPSKATLKLAAEAGPGQSSYQDYDEKITDAAVEWIKARAGQRGGKPWTLFVSLVCPHFPLISRPEFYNLYPEDQVPLPMLYGADERPSHPFIDAMRIVQCYDEGFDSETKIRRAIAAYFGMVSFLDHNIGRLMRALEEAGLMDSTRVLYTSDHGDNLGCRGLWGKSNMYQDSVAVPLIMAGPDIPAGHVCHEPVTLVDAFPTILHAVGAPQHPDDADLPGSSLFDVMRGLTHPRDVLSEYHAVGSVTGAFMLRRGSLKFIHYAGMEPQLFDLRTDPWETRNLAADPDWAGPRRDCEAALRAICDPDVMDALAFADQAARIEAVGGREAIFAQAMHGYTPAPTAA
ncbi:sulfatase-like hydrolase/transferase [Belnapia sp. T6]|uniref:Sulfatase-like hydrolase/transferase n=1 Tax=Belnapia mucosa TaxID=2804532 RepID=A0ABS1VAS4_9PROT|nr:sulfatase-like hydrolase/transferase [Belnapia mucosa]MBL6458241.1 sulfatase-like hydrolase/transferase [Belnapia mucosa]